MINDSVTTNGGSSNTNNNNNNNNNNNMFDEKMTKLSDTADDAMRDYSTRSDVKTTVSLNLTVHNAANLVHFFHEFEGLI